MRARFSFALLGLSGCFLTSYELHERDAGIDRMDAAMSDGSVPADAQVEIDAATDAGDRLPCELNPMACGPVTTCQDSTCTCSQAVGLDAGTMFFNPTSESLDCTIACNGTRGCRTICRDGEACQTLCGDAANCRTNCLSGSTCDVVCPGKNCSSECAAGAICRYRCEDESCRDIHCAAGSRCTMFCSNPASCPLRCDDGAKRCGDAGVMVCGMACP